MSKRIKIAEDDPICKEWYKMAFQCENMEQLNTFLKYLMDSFEHSYGSTIHAIAAGMDATMRVLNRQGELGLSGQQANIIGQVLNDAYSFKERTYLQEDFVAAQK